MDFTPSGRTVIVGAGDGTVVPGQAGLRFGIRPGLLLNAQPSGVWPLKLSNESSRTCRLA